MALPKFLQPYLPSYDLAKMDLKQDKEIIITQVLNLGDDKAITWLFKSYAIADIKKVIQNPKRGMWHKKSLTYWQKIFDVKIDKTKKELASINLNHPSPALYKEFFKI